MPAFVNSLQELVDRFYESTREGFIVIDGVVALQENLQIRLPHAIVHATPGWPSPNSLVLSRQTDIHLAQRAILVIGGGFVIDVVKLARLRLLGAPLEENAQKSRSGVMFLERVLRGSRSHLVACPTTVGTGSEASSVACLQTEMGLRLVASQDVRPDLQVFCPPVYSTLDAITFARGALEVALRWVGVLLGGNSVDEYLSINVNQWGLEALNAVSAGNRALCGAPYDPLSVALSSTASHRREIPEGMDLYGFKLWYLATSLVETSGLSKMEAMAGLWPTYSKWLESGQNKRLASIRKMTCHIDVDLSLAVIAGIDALCERLQAQSNWKELPVDLGGLVGTAWRRWGAGLPFLGDVPVQVLRSFFSEALD